MEINKIELTIFNKNVLLKNNNGKIIIQGFKWNRFKKLIETLTTSNFELTKYNFSNVKTWDDIVEYFTNIEWNPNIKVITQLERKPYTKLQRGVYI
jgi:hypothetical protein